jgi:hypothetical protein
LNFFRNIFSHFIQESEVARLRKQVEESEKKIEKLTEMVNILATFDERMAKDIRTIASHVALMELSMVDKRKANIVSLKRKTKDDDMIN